ncbi:pyruvate carboxylase [Fusarium circinatum]|uniref:Pyruvate carboxylase n=1 Tax=Fusarium circinatum TaxID=48490 RepID=A0A8H5U3U3_FUSCI|nr:pyruvate carboxylase [Fusarium circinatum]
MDFVPKLLSHDKPMEGPGDLDDSIQSYAGVFHRILNYNPSLMAFSGQAYMQRISSQFSSRSKEPIRSGLEISSDILVPNTALRRERAHEVDLAKSRRHRAKLRSADPIAYANRVTADKQAWAQKNPQRVLDIAAKVRATAKESNRFSYDDCDAPFASQFAPESYLKTDKHAKRVAGVPLALLSVHAQNQETARQMTKESGNYRCTICNKSFGYNYDLEPHMATGLHKRRAAAAIAAS